MRARTPNAQAGRYVAPDSWRPHGSREKYNAEECRCDPCTDANTLYLSGLRQRNGPSSHETVVVEAVAARIKLENLTANGMGLRTIAELSGVHRRTLAQIKRGDVLRIQYGTSERITTIPLGSAPGCRVDAECFREQVAALLNVGLTLKEISGRVGRARLNPKAALVLSGTAEAVDQLYREVFAATEARGRRTKA
jgi:transcriptional regulator with XRE-family HTH domain